jgi:peptidoglycan/xylan/chitin deacetylase (PgdA/CDA1 family)
VNENIEPGSIILLHVMYVSRTESLESVKGIVENLKAKGYKFKTVSEMVE